MENLINKISNYEKQIMVEYINRYAPNSHLNKQCSQFAGIEKILAPWNEAKQNLYNLFGNQLIIKKSFSLEETKSLLRKNMEDFIISSNFYADFYDIQTYIGFPIEYTYFWNTIISIESLLSGYFDFWGDAKKFIIKAHSCKKNPNDIKTYPNEDIAFVKGEKTMKIIKKISDGFEIPGFEEFRLEHSKILNKKNFKGTVTLSIHPLDFMTMSDNNCNWESCMSWKQFGGYRQGTVEMMNSPYVIVAYIDSEKPWDIFENEKYFWSNKRWRCLFLVDNKFISSVKSYPFSYAPLEKYIVNLLAELSEKNLGITYSNDFKIIEDDSYNKFDVPEINGTFILDLETENMYNDFGTTVSYLRLNPSEIPDKLYVMNYSGISECMWCGETLYCDYDEQDRLVCEDCFLDVKCNQCGYHFTNTDRTFEDHDGNLYCGYCFSNYCQQEDITNQYYDQYSLTKVYAVPSEDIFTMIETKNKNKENVFNDPNYLNINYLSLGFILHNINSCKSFQIKESRLYNKKTFANSGFDNFFSLDNVYKVVSGYSSCYIAISKDLYSEEEEKKFNKAFMQSIKEGVIRVSKIKINQLKRS